MDMNNSLHTRAGKVTLHVERIFFGGLVTASIVAVEIHLYQIVKRYGFKRYTGGRDQNSFLRTNADISTGTTSFRLSAYGLMKTSPSASLLLWTLTLR